MTGPTGEPDQPTVVLTGAWASARDRIVKMIRTGVDPLEGALEDGYGSDRMAERYARTVSDSLGVDLGMTYPVVMAGLSAAVQGAFYAPIYTGTGEVLEAALVVQFMGIAEAGQQKSTLLNTVVKPLQLALDLGLDDRRTWCNSRREQAKAAYGATGVAVDQNADEWDRVYNAGYCKSSLTDQGTPEGIRNNIVRNGGHRAVFTAEPDVLREISAYARGNTGGSIGLLLRGWDQERLVVDRAGTDELQMEEPSLPYVILVQPESFRRYTSGGEHDDFVDRGLFSRTWLWRSERAATSTKGFLPYAGYLPPKFGGPVPATGITVTPLAAGRVEYGDRLTALVERSNEYRARKAIWQAWETSAASTWMPKPTLKQREEIGLADEDGWWAHVQLQQLRDELRAAIEEVDAVNPGFGTVVDALAQRVTSHVMRLAALATLADDPGATSVDTAHLTDIGTRILPWLWSGWWSVLHDRLERNAEDQLADELLKNPKMKDLSMAGVIVRSLHRLADANMAQQQGEGFLRSEIMRKARSGLRKSLRADSSPLLAKALNEVVAEGYVTESVTGTDALNQQVTRYKLTALGMQAAKMADA